MTLRDEVQKLATENPELRKHLLPLLRREAAKPTEQELTILKEARKTLQKVMRLTNGKYEETSSKKFSHGTMQGDQWWGQVSFTESGSAGHSWFRLSIFQGVERPPSKPGMYLIETTYGFSDPEGGSEPGWGDKVPGSPVKWVAPEQVRGTLAKVVTAIQSQLAARG